jgi:hypothetical protein
MRLRHRTAVYVFVFGLVIIGMATVTARINPAMPHERAAAWVESRYSSLPNSLAAIAAFPVEYRIAIARGGCPNSC